MFRKKSPPFRSDKYRMFIRKQPCLLCDSVINIDPHHIRTIRNSGGAQKPSDLWCIPLCHTCHVDVHEMGDQILKKMPIESMIVDFINEFIQQKGA